MILITTLSGCPKTYTNKSACFKIPKNQLLDFNKIFDSSSSNCADSKDSLDSLSLSPSLSSITLSRFARRHPVSTQS